MPRYDYDCRTCGASFTIRLSMAEYGAGDSRRCPECASPDVTRRFGPVNVVTAGGGTESSGGVGCSTGFG